MRKCKKTLREVKFEKKYRHMLGVKNDRDIILIDLHRKTYDVSVNFTPARSVSGHAVALVDIIHDRVISFGTEAWQKKEEDGWTKKIYPFERPDGDRILVKVFEMMLVNVITSEHLKGPAVSLVYSGRFSDKEYIMFRKAVFLAGYDCVSFCGICSADRKYLFG